MDIEKLIEELFPGYWVGNNKPINKDIIKIVKILSSIEDIETVEVIDKGFTNIIVNNNTFIITDAQFLFKTIDDKLYELRKFYKEIYFILNDKTQTGSKKKIDINKYDISKDAVETIKEYLNTLPTNLKNRKDIIEYMEKIELLINDKIYLKWLYLDKHTSFLRRKFNIINNIAIEEHIKIYSDTYSLF